MEDESAAEILLARTQGLVNEQSGIGVVGREEDQEELQNELKELDNVLRRMNRGIAQKEASCRKIDEEIAPLDRSS